MLHAIHNDFLSVTVNERGAELWSVLGKDGTEYLWQGDEKYWGDRALTIFPFVARLWQGCYQMDGVEHEMPIHGFAPTSHFALAEKTNERMVLELTDNSETWEQYPRRFVFRAIYELNGNELAVTYEAENHDEKPMYFGLGGHPGFNVPLENGKAFEDYRLRFSEACEPVRVGFSEDCFVNGNDTPYALEKGCLLPLRHGLFDDDAIVLKNAAREVTLEAEDGQHSVTVSYPDLPYLGIWHKPKTDAPYVCIEPWSALPADHGQMTVFEEKPDLIRLESRETYRNRWTIRIHERAGSICKKTSNQV